jgi:hypothetical protein
MLSVMYGVSAMIPITFGVAGYALVSRDGSISNLSITPDYLSATQLTTGRVISVDTLND